MMRVSVDRILPPVKWLVGEHVALVGDTGSGKTYLASQLVKYREYVIVLRTKPDDILFRGFKKSKDGGILNDLAYNKILVDLTNMRTLRTSQAEKLRFILDEVWRMGRWTVLVDEGFYVQQKLGLKNELEMLFTQARSLGVTMLTGMQRPAWVTRFALSEAKHVFSFRMEGRDLKTIAETTTAEMADVVKQLPRYHFAHFYRPTREIRIGEAHALPKVLLLPPPVAPQRRR
jgi:ABC-type dipeptide/oligopeptide/nickel transport system ATPase component